MNNTNQHIGNTIDGVSVLPSPDDQTSNIIATSAFNLTDRLQIFSYLVNSNRIRWYRVIMRTFLQQHRELYRYQLTAQEVRDAVRDTFDAVRFTRFSGDPKHSS